MKPTWPEKRECHISEKLKHTAYAERTEGNIEGFNEALALCDAYLEAHKPHACKCQRHPDAAFTAKDLGEGLMGCPGCGGIILPRTELRERGGK